MDLGGVGHAGLHRGAEIGQHVPIEHRAEEGHGHGDEDKGQQGQNGEQVGMAPVKGAQPIEYGGGSAQGCATQIARTL
ncbi:hypothetical protein D3C86_1927080 [compost metagenome]